MAPISSAGGELAYRNPIAAWNWSESYTSQLLHGALRPNDLLFFAGPVVVAGPAGVGKTRLVADWLARSDRAAIDVVATHSSAAVPFGAFAPWLPADPLAAQHLLTTLGGLARRLGALHPATIVVDDAHLLDDASAALVLQLARRRRGWSP